MVAFLFCGVSLVYEFVYDFDISENDSSTCVVELSTYFSSSVIVGFPANFPLSAALIVASLRERLFFVGDSDTTSDNNS